MHQAAGDLAFERAALLRDKWEALDWLREQLDRLKAARRDFSFVYKVAGVGGKDLWYLIRGGRTVAVVVHPRDEETRIKAGALLQQTFPGKKGNGGTLAPHEVDGLWLVTTWFRRYPEERKRTLQPAEALVLCR
jgi:hypothetical protein